MEDFYNSSLIQSIKDKIKTNNNKSITGNILQEELLKIVSALDLGGMFLGFASKSTNPENEGKSRANGFYFSTEEGTYTNFIGSNNQPLVIGSDLEIIYREVNNDSLNWNHRSIASQLSVSGEENNFVSFDGNGRLQDSGKKATDLEYTKIPISGAKFFRFTCLTNSSAYCKVYYGDKIKFVTIDANTGALREAIITVPFTQDKSIEIPVTQEAGE